MSDNYTHDFSLILDNWREGYFALPLIRERNMQEMDDLTIGYFDDMTLLEVSMPT